jgi:hypothetical protein
VSFIQAKRFNHFDFVLWRKRTAEKDSEGEHHVPSAFFVGVEADFQPGRPASSPLMSSQGMVERGEEADLGALCYRTGL